MPRAYLCNFSLRQGLSGKLIADLEVQGGIRVVHELVQLLHAADHLYNTANSG